MTKTLRDSLYGNPYDGIVPYVIPGMIQGWNSQDQFFAKIIDEIRPKTILEIGTWLGASAINMATLAPDAEIVCIDTWLGAGEFMGPQNDVTRNLRLKNGYPQVYYQFLNNVAALGMQDRITPIPQTSQIACRWLLQKGFNFDLIYIDGSHETADVAADIASALPLLMPFGSAIFGDDADHPPVQAALRPYNHIIEARKWRILK